MLLYSAAAGSCINNAAAAKVADSPRLYHMSLILKPMVFLMSPYLRRSSIKGQVNHAGPARTTCGERPHLFRILFRFSWEKVSSCSVGWVRNATLNRK